ncbi:MAG: molybdopterin-guanine dinucleotide biosynthesis protein MobB, partial [Gemmatimonadota bacterium]|nr:molybdopterin-guanine dinucleotide biosynthesis protein MobB [Gemmatimonadota bacterium]
PETIAARFLADADLVLCEGFKHSTLPKVEISRREVFPTSLWADGVGETSTWRALVTDAPPPDFPGAIFSLSDVRWLEALADWTETHFLPPR